MPIITKDRIIFSGEDWQAGLNSQYNTFTPGLVDGSPVAFGSNFNPNRPNGIASPGNLAQNVTNIASVTGLVVGGINNSPVPAFTNPIYGILIDTSGKIQQLNYFTNTITPSGTFPYTISDGHSSIVGEDIVAYTANVSSVATRLAFYSFRDATDWNVGSYDYATTFNDDFMSTVPASPLAAPYITGGKSAPHPMVVGSDDILYVGDRNFLHGFDGQTGTDGTFTAGVIVLPAGYTITSFSKTQNYLVIYAYRQDQTSTSGDVSGEATAFFWNYIDDDITQAVDLNDNYVNGGFLFDGQPACFTSGRPAEGWEGVARDKDSDLRVFNGNGFTSEVSFDGAVPIYHGVDVLSDEIQWNSGGTVFSYAEKKKGTGYRLNQVSSGSGSSSGFLKTMTAVNTLGGQYISSGTTNTTSLQAFLATSFSTSATLWTTLVQPPVNIGQINRLTAVEVRLYTLGDATNYLNILRMRYLGGNGSTTQTVFTDTYFTKYNNIYRSDVNAAALMDFNRIGFNIGWTSDGNTPPCIDSIILHFEPINI